MSIKSKTLQGYKLQSLDGVIGHAKEFYFDDRHWAIRYLVADTGGWLTGRQVLISPYALGPVLKDEQQITINLTKKHIEGSPSLGSDKPVSRQFEEIYYGYYAFPTYWTGPYMWGSSPYLIRNRTDIARDEKAWDPHLRSTHDVSGRHIEAIDGEIGHVDDFIIDDETWAIRYLVVDTQNWWPGKKVLISPNWIERLGHRDSKVRINLSQESIRKSPEYTDESLVSREYETGLHQHYDRPGYWVDRPAAKAHHH